MEVTISPFTLKFSEDYLEREYVAHSAARDHRYHELIFVCLENMMLISLLFSGRIPFSWGFFLNGIAIIVLHFASLLLIRVEIWIRHRFWFHLVLRAYRTWMLVTWNPVWTIPDGEKFPQTFMYRSGILAIFWYGLGMKTVVWQYVLLQGFNTIFFCAAKFTRCMFWNLRSSTFLRKYPSNVETSRRSLCRRQSGLSLS